MSVDLQILTQQNCSLYIFENDYFIGSCQVEGADFRCHLKAWYKTELQYFASVFDNAVLASGKALWLCMKE